MQRRTLLAVIALIAVTVACTRPEITAITEPLAPPDTFAPSTTVTTQRRTTTTIDTERAAIYRVDPITLEPIAGFDPIPVGDWAWGVSSEDGSWLALNLGHDNQNLAELRLIDIDNWEVTTTWWPSIDTPLHVTDNGTIYVINGSPPNFHLSRMVPDETRPLVIADLPPELYWWELHIHDGLALIFGLNSPDGDNRGEAVIVTVDLTTGTVVEIPLPGVEVGWIAEFDIGEEFPWVIDANPAVIWDDDRSRVLIVSANQDLVTEVIPTTGEIRQHNFRSEIPEPIPVADGAFTNRRRNALLARDGGSLYVATAVQEFEVVDTGWTEQWTSRGIEAIDTEIWEVVDRLEAPISEIYLSSAGDRFLATGQSYTSSSSTYESEPSGLYVIDAVDLEVVAHHGADEVNQYYGGVSFHPGMRIGYVQSWDQLTNIDVVNLENGNIVNTRTGPEFQFFADAQVLVEVVQG